MNKLSPIYTYSNNFELALKIKLLKTVPMHIKNTMKFMLNTKSHGIESFLSLGAFDFIQISKAEKNLNEVLSPRFEIMPNTVNGIRPSLVVMFGKSEDVWHVVSNQRPFLSLTYLKLINDPALPNEEAIYKHLVIDKTSDWRNKFSSKVDVGIGLSTGWSDVFVILSSDSLNTTAEAVIELCNYSKPLTVYTYPAMRIFSSNNLSSDNTNDIVRLLHRFRIVPSEDIVESQARAAKIWGENNCRITFGRYDMIVDADLKQLGESQDLLQQFLDNNKSISRSSTVFSMKYIHTKYPKKIEGKKNSDITNNLEVFPMERRLPFSFEEENKYPYLATVANIFRFCSCGLNEKLNSESYSNLQALLDEYNIAYKNTVSLAEKEELSMFLVGEAEKILRDTIITSYRMLDSASMSLEYGVEGAQKVLRIWCFLYSRALKSIGRLLGILDDNDPSNFIKVICSIGYRSTVSSGYFKWGVGSHPSITRLGRCALVTIPVRHAYSLRYGPVVVYHEAVHFFAEIREPIKECLKSFDNYFNYEKVDIDWELERKQAEITINQVGQKLKFNELSNTTNKENILGLLSDKLRKMWETISGPIRLVKRSADKQLLMRLLEDTLCDYLTAVACDYSWQKMQEWYWREVGDLLNEKGFETNKSIAIEECNMLLTNVFVRNMTAFVYRTIDGQWSIGGFLAAIITYEFSEGLFEEKEKTAGLSTSKYRAFYIDRRKQILQYVRFLVVAMCNLDLLNELSTDNVGLSEEENQVYSHCTSSWQDDIGKNLLLASKMSRSSSCEF